MLSVPSPKQRHDAVAHDSSDTRRQKLSTPRIPTSGMTDDSLEKFPTSSVGAFRLFGGEILPFCLEYMA